MSKIDVPFKDEERKIKAIYFDDQSKIEATEEKPIIKILKNGEMASVDWFEFGNCEFNGKYVTCIEYYE